MNKADVARLYARAEYVTYQVTVEVTGTPPGPPEQFMFFGPAVLFNPDLNGTTISRSDDRGLLTVTRGDKPLVIRNRESMWVFGRTGAEDIPGHYPSGTLVSSVDPNPFLGPIRLKKFDLLGKGSVIGRPTWRLIDEHLHIDIDQEYGIVLAAEYPDFRIAATSITILDSLDATWDGPTVPRDDLGNVISPKPAPTLPGAIDHLPPLADGRLRIHVTKAALEYHKVDWAVGDVTAMPLRFHTSSSPIQGLECEVRCQVRHDGRPPVVEKQEAWWQGLALGDGWCAQLISDSPISGDVTLAGYFKWWAYDFDRTSTWLRIESLYAVVSDENDVVLQQLSRAENEFNDYSPNGWETKGYIVDATPVPLSEAPVPEQVVLAGHVAADEKYLWIAAVGFPLVEAYDARTGEFSHRVSLAAPIGRDPLLKLASENQVVAVINGEVFPLGEAPVALANSAIDRFIEPYRGVSVKHDFGSVEFWVDELLTSFERTGAQRIFDATPERIRMLTTGQLHQWTPETGWTSMALTGGQFVL
ncbi:hypothetical protein CKALI_04660 [Corynebacterium kalinowskii]|uniref:Uncharacterized protein n=1 Tax=Corynebacterium kalinowskii TaxID=2675216 RepID=A0A6B8VWY7_9CORY|nr:hypothetical protein [Corynebacterium kalinowskii]QGU01810.1 hypothetical protein CKALI_04660 [Corynebacterium kalinowskii]